jgi:hypothetical protein
MYVYTVATATRHYAVTLEWDGWTVPGSERDLLVFAQGAASMRDGGPVGGAAIHSRDDDACRAVVWVEAIHPDGPTQR